MCCLLSSFLSFAQADLVVTNTDFKTTYIPGTDNVYTVTVINYGPQAAVNVNVSNAIPAGINYFYWQGSNGSSGENIPLLNTIPSLPAGAMVTYIITMEIPGALNGNLISETVVTSTTPDPNPGCTQCIDIDTKAIGADVEIVNTNNQDAYIPGSTTTYSVTVKNNGPLTAANVHVQNAIPAGITNFSWVGSDGSSGTNAPINEVITSLPANEQVVFTITVQIPSSFTGNLINAATWTTPTVDPVPGCTYCIDTDVLYVAPPPEADIVTTITDSQTTYTPGESSVYTVTVINNGPDDAINVNVSTGIPAGITQFSWTGTNGSSGTNVALSDLIATLANGQTVTYTITVGVPISFTGPLTLNASTTSATADPVPSCLTCTDINTSESIADIVVTNTNNQSVYVPGSTVTYEVVVTNNGPHSAQNVNVLNAIPAGITQFSWTGSNGSSGVNIPINNTIPTLTNGAVVTYTITMVIPAGHTGNLNSTVAVSSATTDPDASCAACTDIDTQATTGADISVVNTNNQNSYTPGTSSTYIVTVTNNGPQVRSESDV